MLPLIHNLSHQYRIAFVIFQKKGNDVSSIRCSFSCGLGRGAWAVWGVECLGRRGFGAFAKLSNWGVIQLRRLNRSSNPS